MAEKKLALDRRDDFMAPVMQTSKKAFYLLGLVSLAGAVVAFVQRSEVKPPQIRFLEITSDEAGRQAVFRVSNDSEAAFCYTGYGPTAPLYSLRIQKEGRWEKPSSGWCGTGAGLVTIAPHSSVDFKVFAPEVDGGVSFQAGIGFEQGAASEVVARDRSKVGQWISYIRYRLLMQEDVYDTEMTWSESAQLSR